MKHKRVDVLSASAAHPVLTKRFLGTRVRTVGGLTILQKSKKGTHCAKVEVFVAHPLKVAQETAERIRAIVAAPISSEQRLKVTKLVDKAKTARQSAVTARFRKA